MRLLRCFCVALLFSAFACGHQSPEEKLVKTVGAAAGWIPTLQMTAEKWLSNSVPSTFVRNVADAATKEFEKAQKQIDKSKAKPELRQRLTHDLRQGRDFAEALHRAAEEDEPRRIAPAVPTLSLIKDDLDAIEKQYGGGSS